MLPRHSEAVMSGGGEELHFFYDSRQIREVEDPQHREALKDTVTQVWGTKTPTHKTKDTHSVGRSSLCCSILRWLQKRTMTHQRVSVGVWGCMPSLWVKPHITHKLCCFKARLCVCVRARSRTAATDTVVLTAAASPSSQRQDDTSPVTMGDILQYNTARRQLTSATQPVCATLAKAAEQEKIRIN